MTIKIAVIGAGLSGLSLSRQMQKKGFAVDIFDKARGVGGRMSSRRTSWGYIDHGTQYFTVKHPLFQEFLQDYDSVVSVWNGKFARWQEGELRAVLLENPRYVASVGMNNLCKSMGLEVRLETRIIALEKSSFWTLMDENGQKYSGYDFVVVTAPPAQSYDLLKLHTKIASSIEPLKMYACFSLMMIPETKRNLPFDGIEFPQHPVLGWVAMNDSKPLRGEKGGIVMQSNFTWAEDNLEENRDVLTEIIKKNTEDIFQVKFGDSVYESLHLWRYALPVRSNEKGYYLDEDNNIGICGDWCLNGKVESAFLSSYYLAEKLSNL
jgi:predicted NAD/FAD-dependent oxidoreductase